MAIVLSFTGYCPECLGMVEFKIHHVDDRTSRTAYTCQTCGHEASIRTFDRGLTLWDHLMKSSSDTDGVSSS